MAGTIAPHAKLSAALDLAPGVVDDIVSLNPHDFERLRKPLMRRLMAPRITPDCVATMVGVPVAEVLAKIGALSGAATAGAAARAPLPQSPEARPAWLTAAVFEEVRLGAMDETLEADPMLPTMAAIQALKPGDVLKVRHKGEPQPFYDLWMRIGGLEGYSEQAGPEEWGIRVRRLPS